MGLDVDRANVDAKRKSEIHTGVGQMVKFPYSFTQLWLALPAVMV